MSCAPVWSDYLWIRNEADAVPRELPVVQRRGAWSTTRTGDGVSFWQ